MELRYLGFNQQDNTRTYRFNCVRKGSPDLPLEITAELELFVRNHVAIQEGPELCAKKLTADLDQLCPGVHELTNEDFTAFTAARAAAAEHKAGMRSRQAKRRPVPHAPSPYGRYWVGTA